VILDRNVAVKHCQEAADRTSQEPYWNVGSVVLIVTRRQRVSLLARCTVWPGWASDKFSVLHFCWWDFGGCGQWHVHWLIRCCCCLSVVQVCERGVSAIPLSVDLWLHYIAFTVDQCRLHDILDADQKIEMYDLW